MSDETKLAITDCASCGFAVPKTFGAGGHCDLLSALSQLFIPFFTVARDESVRFSDACSLDRSRQEAQLHVGKGPAAKGVTELYEGVWSLPLTADVNLPTASLLSQGMVAIRSKPDQRTKQCEPIVRLKQIWTSTLLQVVGIAARARRNCAIWTGVHDGGVVMKKLLLAAATIGCLVASTSPTEW